MNYEPKGRMRIWLAAMKAEPERIWTSSEAAVLMGIRVNKVGGYAAHAAQAGAIYRQNEGKPARWGLKPPEGGPVLKPPKAARWSPKAIPQWEPGDDIRVPRAVPGWRPPQMVAPRG